MHAFLFTLLYLVIIGILWYANDNLLTGFPQKGIRVVLIIADCAVVINWIMSLMGYGSHIPL